MNDVTRVDGFLVVMVDWTDGKLVPIAHVDTQADADEVIAGTNKADADAVVYAMRTTAYGR